MKITHFALLSSCIIASDAAFVSSPSQPAGRRSTYLAAIDPAVALQDPTLIAGAAGAVIAAVAASVAVGKGAGGDKTAVSKPVKVDVSIPYDAAATLAYNVYAGSSSKSVNFEEFKPLYEAQMVAEVKAKAQSEKVNEKKTAVEALQKELAVLEGELSDLEGDLSGCNNEASDYKSQIEELFA